LAVVRNYPVLDELATLGNPYAERPNQVAYVGSLAEWRGVKEMVHAMDHVNPEFASKLVIAGAFGSESLRKAVSEYSGWKRVDHRGWCERHEVAEVLSQSRCGLAVLWPTASHNEALPVNMFEYMSAGIPVIASDLPLWRNIIGGETNCGILVDPMDPQAIASAIDWVFSNPQKAREMGERGRNATETLYNWSKEGERMLALYQDILS
jgi:glycosyltransferase involved in cell wall biosynthesis